MPCRLAVAIVAGLSLGGCSHDEFGRFASRSSALAQSVPPVRAHHARQAKPQYAGDSLAAFKDTAADDDSDEALAKKLVICRGCDQPEPVHQANSIWPKPTTEGHYLTVDEVSRLLPGQPVSNLTSRSNSN
jgi:hypothetical protein